METQMEDMQQHEDEYLSGRYDCESLSESLKDLFIAVHRESDIRQKQIACLDLRSSQRWQHTELLQRQIEALAKQVEPLLDEDLPKLQWFKDRIEELDCDVKDFRSAGEKTLATLRERMVDLERNVCGVCVGPPDELSATNGLIKPQHCTVVTSDSSCSLGHSEEMASAKCPSEAQATPTSDAKISIGKAAIPAVTEEVLCNEVGQNDDSGTVCSKACDEQGRAAQSHCSTSSDAVSLSSTSLPVIPTDPPEERSVRGSRVRRLVMQFTDGAGAASCSSAAAKPLVEPLDVSSCVVARHSQQRQQLARLQTS